MPPLVKPRDPRDEILAALGVLFREDQVVELRAPKYPRGNATTAGYFDDADALAGCALALSGNAPGVYVTLNEIDPALLARIRNRVEPWAKQTTADADVIQRRWLPLDFDPVRPDGISSTDTEHEAALERARQCRQWLKGQGWPDPILADSGNGAHLLYRIDLPNDAAAKILVDFCLKAVAAQFSDEIVTVDTKVGNAGRIWKLYGTLAAKGDGTEDRPHREARMLTIPDKVLPIEAEKLEALAALAPEHEAVGRKAGYRENGRGHRLDVARWLEARGVDFRLKSTEASGGRAVYEIVCPFNEEHQNAAVMQDGDGKLSAHCFHSSCEGRGWQEFKAKIGPPDPDHYDPPLGGIPVVKIVSVVPPELAPAAYHGVAGEFLRAVAKHTEATDAAVLAHLLPAVGMLAGPKVHVWSGGKQPARVNVCVVGPTNTGRKGTSFAPVDLLMQKVAGQFWDQQRPSGLSSGEGLIVAVADKEEKDDDGNIVIVPTEKRLFVPEQEFSRVLANIRREGNVLSQVIRSCYDDGNLATLTVSPRRASGAHILIVGHITQEELKERLTEIDMANGFGNRFLWFHVRSDKVMPDTQPIPNEVFEPFMAQLRAIHRLGTEQKTEHPVKRDAAANKLWVEVYINRLRQDQPGLAGAMVSRGAPMVVRLALIYALLDCPQKKPTLLVRNALDLNKLVIRAEHLQAALAVWDYCEQSAHQLFKNKSGDPLGDKLLGLMGAGPVTRQELNRHMSNEQKTNAGPALAKLEDAGLARKTKVSATGAGRPAELWERIEATETIVTTETTGG